MTGAVIAGIGPTGRGGLQATAKTERSESPVFKSFMDGASAGNVGEASLENKKVVKQETDSEDYGVCEDADREEEIAGSDSMMKEDAAEPVSDNGSNIQKLSETDSPEAAQEMQDATRELEADIKALIMDRFGISEEDLTEIMENMGMEAMELLNPSSLAKIAVALSGGTDMASLITDSGLYKDYMELVGAMNELKEDARKDSGLSEEEFSLMTQMYSESKRQADVTPSGIQATAVVQKEAEYPQGTSVSDGAVELKVEISSEMSVTDKGSQNAGAGVSGTTQSDGGGFAGTLMNRISEVAAASGQTAEDVQNIVRQISEEIRIAVRPDTTSIEMQLNPENLGKVTLHLSSRDGAVSAQFVAQNQAVKEAIEGQLVQLRETLGNQGVKVESIEVTVESHETGRDPGQGGNSSGHPEQSGNRGRRSIDLRELIGNDRSIMSEEEAITANIMMRNGNSVDYTA